MSTVKTSTNKIRTTKDEILGIALEIPTGISEIKLPSIRSDDFHVFFSLDEGISTYVMGTKVQLELSAYDKLKEMNKHLTDN